MGGVVSYLYIFFNQKMQNFLGKKAFFCKTEMKISTFQDAGHNLNGAPNMAYSISALIMIYDELNRFTGTLTYS